MTTLVSAYSMYKIWYVGLEIQEEHCKQEDNRGYLTESLWWLIVEEIYIGNSLWRQQRSIHREMCLVRIYTTSYCYLVLKRLIKILTIKPKVCWVFISLFIIVWWVFSLAVQTEEGNGKPPNGRSLSWGRGAVYINVLINFLWCLLLL